MTDMRIRKVTGEVVAEGRARARISTFNDPYEYAPRVREEITPTTFDLGTSNTIPVMYQHQHDEPPIGVATLSQDTNGIDADVQFFMDTERGRAAFNAYQSGAMKEWSIGFTAKPGDITITRSTDGYANERIDRGDMLEVSTVLRGANKKTSTLHTRAYDGTLESGPASSSAYGQDEGAAAEGGHDSDTHEIPLHDESRDANMNDAMAVMAGALKQINAAHALLERAHAGAGGLLAPSTDDNDDDSTDDQGGPVLQDPAAAPGAALRHSDAIDLRVRELFRDRTDYSVDARKTMADNGQAMPDGSYPIANADDLENAIRAVGRGSDNHEAIRRHIIARAKALGLASRIPSNWGANGEEVNDRAGEGVHQGMPDRYRDGDEAELELRYRAIMRRVSS